jgi:hypothetical protein
VKIAPRKKLESNGSNVCIVIGQQAPSGKPRSVCIHGFSSLDLPPYDIGCPEISYTARWRLFSRPRYAPNSIVGSIRHQRMLRPMLVERAWCQRAFPGCVILRSAEAATCAVISQRNGTNLRRIFRLTLAMNAANRSRCASLRFQFISQNNFK